ncbi:hypothetical protein AMS68_004940 [Peltaster fructicola]|uniref:GH64 domain-containing protein n=1 Tax=Peltaster fructicola TaxID=286661 RepID=A0A6H0XXE1_9PEZI|nr:hypothetical protein AMS68_004940 [Peltaster fructicola]
MRGLSMIIAAASLLLTFASAAPVITVHPGNANTGLVITKENTVNATKVTTWSNSTGVKINAALTTGALPLALVNNFPGGAINAYVTGLDANGQLVMLKADGTFYYPTATSGPPQQVMQNCAIPLGAKGSTLQITVPGYISSARIWFAEGQLKFYTVQGANGPSLVEPSAVNPNDPSASVNWGFVELTYNSSGGLYANISYVDFLGLILGMQLQCGDGSTQGARGLSQNSVQAVCSALSAQAGQDGAPWGDLCQADSSGNMLRVLAPTDFISSSSSAFSSYWSSYIDQVWSKYTSEPLYIDTQSSPGKVACQVQGSQLQCAGDNRSYSKPTALDIFGCNSGPFGIQAGDNLVHVSVVPRLCAAFHRTTLLLPGGNVQPSLDSSHYYTTTPTNYFSKLIHQYELDGKGYAFAYDDVNPDGDVNQSGTVVDANPQLLTIYVGGNTS